MKSAIYLTAVAALVVASCVATAAQEQGASTYDPSPFLSSMITLRTAAVTCDKFVANGPAARTETIPAFFKTLKQDLPNLVDTTTQRSLDQFIGSQAAVLCREKLDAAMLGYQAQAAGYLQGKPEDWPEPPAISAAPWCSSENCLEF